jgi:Flp pilus assembly CpaE family ATPase
MRVPQFLGFLQDLHAPQDRIHLVATRCGQPMEIPHGKAEQALGIHVPHRIPNDPASMNMCANLGVPLVLEAPRCKSALAIARLYEKLEGVVTADARPPRPKWFTNAASLLSFVGCC